jgi:hypothetical protein
MGPKISPETLALNYHPTLRKILEERVCNPHRAGSLQSRTVDLCQLNGVRRVTDAQEKQQFLLSACSSPAKPALAVLHLPSFSYRNW